MPVLHEYSDAYKKSGYYVKVNWGASHPYPLQTPAITEEIYTEFGFEPGDDIPNELTSRLCSAGLHWTEGSDTGEVQEQTVTDSIAGTDLPTLTQTQLDKLYKLLSEAETQIKEIDIDSTALEKLRTEIDDLQVSGEGNTGNQRTGPISEQTEAILKELTGKDLETDEAARIRADAANPQALDRSIKQFTRKHPITVRDFEINSHSDPTFTFQTDSIEWKLTDCRGKGLDFDWAVTIASDTDQAFDVRVRSNGLVRTVFDGSTLSEQQAVDLVEIIPCLLWTLDSVKEYQLSTQWHVTLIEQDVPPSQYDQLVEQAENALSTLQTNSTSNRGSIIDYPGRHFARIRGTNACIVCAPTESLPNDAESGTDVTFDVERRNATNYATDISVLGTDDPTWPDTVSLEKELAARLSDGFAEGEFPEQTEPIDEHEPDVDVTDLSDKPNNILLKIKTDHTTKYNGSIGYFRATFSVSEDGGMHSVTVLTDIVGSWRAKGSIYALLAEYIPVVATALEHKNIDSGSYYSPLSVTIDCI